MNKGLTYFRLTSPYEGDVTKNCALDGFEVDSNFFTLEGRDVKSVTVDGDELIITLVNGNKITSTNAFTDFTKDLSFDFDSSNGILYITRNGVTQKIPGFATEYNNNEEVKTVATDETIKGNGKPYKPIGLSVLYKTGQYRPVQKVVDMTNCEKLPYGKDVTTGDRFLTIENVSEYGFLYDYDGVKKIACDLVSSHSPWRIPTKEDWDDMLNAIEPCNSDRDHGSATCNRYFGKFAGKFLKSKEGWKLESCPDTSTCINYGDTDADNICTCGNNTPCSPQYCGEYTGCVHKKPLHPNVGIDKYGFKIMPAGYADDGGQYGYFMERASFWTANNKQLTSVYIKRFEYNKSTVYQDIVSKDYNLSLRLVKDYDGNNYNERESILGQSYSTVLMPSVKKGKAIWTSTNIAFNNKCYCPVLPNDGMNIECVKKYFINEWDGKHWLKNEVSEGETVVIEKAPNGEQCSEYIVLNGSLVSVANKIFEQVVTAVEPKLNELDTKINNETERAIAKENEIVNNLQSEIDRSTAKDTELEESISSLQEHVNSSDEKFNEAVNAFNQFKEETNQTFTEVKQSISDESAARQEKDNELQANIENEASIREQKDNEILEKISNDEETISGLSSKLEQEISDRREEDERLQENINNVIQDVESVKTDLNEHKSDSDKKFETINTAISEEITNRTNADNELANNIENVDKKTIIKDGTMFDSSTGVLTLKSKGGENDIEIQFAFNFGDI